MRLQYVHCVKSILSAMIILFSCAITDAVIYYCYTEGFDMRKQGYKLSLFIVAALVQLWSVSRSIKIHNYHDHHQQCLVYKNKAQTVPCSCGKMIQW